MKVAFRFQIIALLILCRISSFGQRQISKDGNYVWVSQDKTAGKDYTPTLVVENIQSYWKMIIDGLDNGVFSPDSKQFIYQLNDTIFSIHLGAGIRDTIAGKVGSFQVAGTENGEWLILNQTPPENGLVLINLKSGTKRIFASVSDWQINDNASCLYVIEKNNGRDSMRFINLNNGSEMMVWSGDAGDLKRFVVDRSTEQVAFIRTERQDSVEHSEIWHFEPGMNKVTMLFSDEALRRDSGISISTEFLSFVQGSRKLHFNLQPLPVKKERPGMIDLWRYSDPRMYSLQKQDKGKSRTFAAIIDVEKGSLIRLEYEHEILLKNEIPGVSDGIERYQLNDDYALICHFNGNIFAYDRQGEVVESYSMMEYNWNKATESSIFLISLKDGKRRLIKQGIRSTCYNFPLYKLSPGRRFIIYYDQVKNNYITYDIKTKQERNITGGIQTSWTIADPELSVGRYYIPRGVVNWMDNDSRVLIYDHFGDVWLIDPESGIKPMEVTAGFCKQYYNTVNRYELISFANSERPLKSQDPIYFGAVHSGSPGIGYGYDGYYKYAIEGINKFQPLIPVNREFQNDLTDYSVERNQFLFKRNNAETAPQYYLTSDFKVYRPITDGQTDKRPADKVKKEVLTWRSYDNTICEGVLYYPKNFDSHKKYPVIVDYYEKNRSNFRFECFATGQIHPFIDSSYFYFYPDIHFTIGQTGKSAFNCVVSGTKFLARRPYIDRDHMGATGESFSGYETNYLITHTNIFKAAFSGYGMSDFLSDFGNDDHDAQDLMQNGMIESGQWRIGVTPWDRPDIYLANSPVLYADKVTTPLLIAHYYTDTRCPFIQSIELFKALRRLGKPVWLFANDGESHGGDTGGSTFADFFNYYLKGSPAPKWMFEDVAEPAQMAIDAKTEYSNKRGSLSSGLKYDQEQRTPQQKLLLSNKTRVDDRGFVAPDR